MAIIIIVAVGTNGVMGKAGKLPWGKPIPADMKHFRKHTLCNTVVMGRKTWESIGAKPLPGRINIVLTRNENFIANGAHVASNVSTILEIAQEQDVFVIGGSQIYAEFLAFATKMHITIVGGNFLGDTLFPEYDRHSWEQMSLTTLTPSEKTLWFNLQFIEYSRISPTA